MEHGMFLLRKKRHYKEIIMATPSYIGGMTATVTSGKPKAQHATVYGNAGTTGNDKKAVSQSGNFRDDVTAELRKQFKQ